MYKPEMKTEFFEWKGLNQNKNYLSETPSVFVLETFSNFYYILNSGWAILETLA